MALGLAAIMAMTAMTGCGGSSSAKTDSTTGGEKKQAEATSGKEKITLRIGSGHSESNPWITALEDVNGMKIGAAGINLSWIEGSGAVGVQTSLNDTYQNLQTNVCQATIQPTHSCVNLKVYEVAPYYLDANFNVVPFNAITVNMDTWNDLPEDVQNIISEVGEGYLDYESEYINTIHEEDIKALEEQGCTVTTLSREEQEKWAASLPDVVNGLVKSLDDAGYNGSEIVEDYYEILESKGVERVRDWKISE